MSQKKNSAKLGEGKGREGTMGEKSDNLCRGRELKRRGQGR